MTVFIIQNTIIYTIPLLIVALGGMFAERSGVINLALEGEMIFGAFMGAVPHTASRCRAQWQASAVTCI